MSQIQFIDHPPRIFLVGVSTPSRGGMADYLAYRGEEWNQQTGERLIPMDPHRIAEMAGRVCYMSYENKGNKTVDQYLEEQIIQHGHESVIEHVWVNLMVADLPVHVQTQLIRHRVGVAYSFESARYTDKHLRFVVPPAIRGGGGLIWNSFRHAIETAVGCYLTLVSEIEVADSESVREERKRRTEAARSVLPVSRASDGMVSMNMRAARHIVTLRSAPGADASMREFAVALFDTLQPFFAPIFADMEKVDHPSGIPIVRKITNG